MNPKEVFHKTTYSVQLPYIAGHREKQKWKMTIFGSYSLKYKALIIRDFLVVSKSIKIGQGCLFFRGGWFLKIGGGMKNCNINGQHLHLFTHFPLPFISHILANKIIKTCWHSLQTYLISGGGNDLQRGWVGMFFTRKYTPMKYSTDLRNNILVEFILE